MARYRHYRNSKESGVPFWQYSFRSVVIESEEMFWQKMHYIHMNPVKAGYVEHAEDYRWSSARLVLEGKLSREDGLSYDDGVTSLGAWSVEEENDA